MKTTRKSIMNLMFVGLLIALLFMATAMSGEESSEGQLMPLSLLTQKIEVRDYNNATTLISAARAGHKDIIETLQRARAKK